MFRLQAQSERIKFQHIFDISVPKFLRSDKNRIQQVLRNYVANAIKFTRKGSIKCEISYDVKDQTLSVAVKDTGCGIKESKLSDLFKPYSVIQANRASHNPNGVGLGLHISKQICENLGGDVGVESKYGKGSTFWFKVNAKRCEKAEAPKKVRKANVANRGSIVAKKSDNGNSDYLLRSQDLEQLTQEITSSDANRSVGGFKKKRTGVEGSDSLNETPTYISQNPSFRQRKMTLNRIKEEQPGMGGGQSSLPPLPVQPHSHKKAPLMIEELNGFDMNTHSLRANKQIYLIDDELFVLVLFKQMITALKLKINSEDILVFQDPVLALKSLENTLE